MPNRPIEDILRKRLSQHPTPLDTDALWAEVEPRLPRERGILPYWISMLVVVVLLGGLYLLFPLQPEGVAPAATTLTPPVTTTAPQTSIAPAAAPTEPPVPVKTIKTTTAPETKPPTPASNPKADIVTPSVISEASVMSVYDVPSSPLLLQEEATEGTPVVTPSLLIADGYRQMVAPGQHNTSLLPSRPAQPADEVKDTSPQQQPETEQTDSQRNKDQRLPAIEAQAPAEHISTLPKTTESTPKKFREKKPAYWTAEPGVALSGVGRSVDAAGDNQDSGQAEINSQYEKGLEAFTVQGLVGYHRPNGLSLRTGIVYSRINSKVASEFTTTGTESVETVVAIIENPDGSRREQTGTVLVATETTTTEQYYNSVRSLDLPLLLGYRFGGTKWGLTLEAGPTFNLGSKGRAHLYDGNGNYRLVNGEHFRKRLSETGFLANFGGGYQLSEKTILTANLRLQGFGKGGLESSSAGYETSYTLLGVQLGYRLRF